MIDRATKIELVGGIWYVGPPGLSMCHYVMIKLSYDGQQWLATSAGLEGFALGHSDLNLLVPEVPRAIDDWIEQREQYKPGAQWDTAPGLQSVMHHPV